MPWAHAGRTGRGDEPRDEQRERESEADQTEVGERLGHVAVRVAHA
jgi:hypothetical protein